MLRVACSSATRWFAGVPLALIVSSLSVSWGCGQSNKGELSFKTDVHPLMLQRCVYCHYEGTQLNLVDPFLPDDGLFEQENTWYEGHGGLQYDLVPYDPDNSNLMRKITDRSLDPATCDASSECPTDSAGLFMPPRLPPATEAQIQLIRDWISDGARDTSDFRNKVVLFFGKWWRFNVRDCSNANYTTPYCLQCTSCHYQDAPITPNLRVPNFEDPSLTPEQANQQVADWLQTVVGVKSRFRADLDLIAPNDPDASFLVMKLEAKEPSSAVGAPMPYAQEPLLDSQVDTIRNWILQGAKNN
jgi:hypothetical protein